MPPFGSRRYVFYDVPPLIEPKTYLCTPARLAWDDKDFRDIRWAVAAHHATIQEIAAGVSDDDGLQARLRFGLTLTECEHLAFQTFSPEPITIRDIFLRAELLTTYYGQGQLSELTGSECAAHRLLGGLLDACWKVGGAANV